MQRVKFSLSDELRQWLRDEASRTRESESSVIRTAILEKKIRSEGKENGSERHP